ncbi:MAG TPA: hypothetical protein VMH83_00105 [Candidatus Acidoferrum sp.]|nr:hypothetical protein [Candidatus Acidoferrum sp.]
MSVQMMMRWFLIFLLSILNLFQVLNAAEGGSPQVELLQLGGDKNPMCRDYANEMLKHRVAETNYCGVGMPENNPDYALMKWADIDPLQNIEIIKVMHYWHNLSLPANDELHRRQRNSREPVRELLDLYWAKAESEVMKWISEGKIHLQHSQFDLDSDGVMEDFYRMTPISGGRVVEGYSKPDPVGIENGCKNFGLPDSDGRYIYYTPIKSSSARINNFLRGIDLKANGFFSYKEKIYLEYDHNIFEFKKNSVERHVCFVQIVGKKK